jgi:hypothetical protein
MKIEWISNFTNEKSVNVKSGYALSINMKKYVIVLNNTQLYMHSFETRKKSSL